MPDTRHPSTTHVLRYFEYDHMPERLQWHSIPFHGLAHELVDHLPDGPELTAGLRKLLEAKDCIVRAAVDQMRDEAAANEPTCNDPAHVGYATTGECVHGPAQS